MSLLIRGVPMVLAMLAILTGPGLTGCAVSSPRFTQEASVTVDHVSGSALAVVNANGAVTAERYDRPEVRIEARLRSDVADRLSGARLMAERVGDGALRIWVEWPGGQRRPNEGADLRIYLPDAAGVNIRSSNGALRLSGFSGTAELTTSNGSVTVTGHDGPVGCETSNGSVRLDGIAGPVGLTTSNGSIAVALTDDNTGPVSARSSNGAITLAVGPAFSGVLRASTSNGSVTVEGVAGAEPLTVGGGRAEIRIGGSDAPSLLETSNGPVRVRGTGPSAVR
jgi:hypothetical protein